MPVCVHTNTCPYRCVCLSVTISGSTSVYILFKSMNSYQYFYFNPSPMDRLIKMRTKLVVRHMEFLGDFSENISNGTVEAKSCLNRFK